MSEMVCGDFAMTWKLVASQTLTLWLGFLIVAKMAGVAKYSKEAGRIQH